MHIRSDTHTSLPCASFSRLLGVSKDASFEEIQDARNYLFEVGVTPHTFQASLAHPHKQAWHISSFAEVL